MKSFFYVFYKMFLFLQSNDLEVISRRSFLILLILILYVYDKRNMHVQLKMLNYQLFHSLSYYNIVNLIIYLHISKF